MTPETTSATCPVCELPLVFSIERQKTLTCSNGHRFDAAKQGYFNFLTGKGTNFLEDTAPMVQAREDFQAKGHYAPLAQRLAELINQHHHRDVLDILDAGAGTGYYLGEVLTATASTTHDALALDISRYAMRRAAKVPSTLAMVWDVWRRLPTADASRDVLLNCFAPHNPAEFRRVLRPNGLCLVVTGQPDHLHEVIEPLGMLSVAEGKQEILVEKFGGEQLEHMASENLSYTMKLDSVDLYNLAFMGPAGHHLSPQILRDKATSLGQQEVTASFGVHIFSPQD